MKFALIASVMAVGLMACGREVGQQGLQGPAGPAGEQGPAGVNGSQGATGSQGPAGVQSEPCSVSRNEDFVTIRCPDGSEVDVPVSDFHPGNSKGGRDARS